MHRGSRLSAGPSSRATFARSVLSRAVLLAGCSLSLAAAPVHAQAPAAQAPAVHHDIPTGPLDQVLNRYAVGAGFLITIDAALTAGKTSPGLAGRYGPREGLATILAGSGLEAVLQPDGSYALRRAPAVAPAAAPAAASAARPEAADDATLPVVRASARRERSATSEDTGRYAAEVTATATGLALSPRETPQSVTVITRQRIEDQAATELSEVFRMTPGLSFSQAGSQGTDGNTVYSRGFAIENYQVDGVPQLNSWLLQTADLAVYDRVEVLRGATGLLNGVGTPAATINLVRKRPTRDFRGVASVGVGSWQAYRGDLDLSGPLSDRGRVRGRVVAALEDKSLHIDRATEDKQVLYGVLEADLTPATLLTAGLEYQRHRADGEGRAGLPLYYADGSRTAFPRSQTGAADWARSYQTHRAAFVNVEHRLDNGWNLRADLGQTRRKYDDVVGYVYGGWPTWPNADGSDFNVIANKWNAEYVQDALDLRAAGPFELFGRRHELVVGANVSRTTYDAPWYNAWQILPIANFLTWDGRTPAEPAWLVTGMTAFEEKQSGAYGTVRLRPADRWSVLLGARVSRWSQGTVDTPAGGVGTAASRRETGVVTPYAGLVFDLTRQWSLYASYTDIFKPQNSKTVSGSYIEPLTGVNLEGGIKGELLDGRLNVSAAYFDVQQDHLAVALPGQLAPDGSPAYRSADGTRTRGYELELSGELARGWQLAAGYTHRSSKDGAGVEINTESPRDQFKLFTSYLVGGIGQGLTVGAGVTWQGAIYADDAGPLGVRFTQRAYAVVDLMTRYAFDARTTVSAHLNNAFDKAYLTTPWYSYYGTPRQLKLVVSHAF